MSLFVRFVLAVALLLANTNAMAAAPAAVFAKDSQEATPQVVFREPAAPLTLERAVAYALNHNLELAAASRQVLAAQEAARQAGFLPNPELSIDIDNFGGKNERSGLASAETTITLNQLVELGGKRDKRKRSALATVQEARSVYQAKRLAVAGETTRAFADVLVAQQRLELAREQLQLAEQVLHTVQERVEAGKVSPIEAVKAKVALASNRIELDRAKRSLGIARRTLTILWGNKAPSFTEAQGELPALLPPLPAMDELAAHLDQHPELAALEAQMEKRRLELKLALASRVPDLTIGGGVRNFQETEDYAAVVSLSFPLMVFNRNQGGISQAKHELAQARALLEAARLSRATKLENAYQELLAAQAMLNAIERQMLPGATTAFNAVQEGYRQGKFSFLEVLDAQRTLFEVAVSHLDSLRQYLAAQVAVRTAAGLEPLETAASQDNVAKP